MIKTIKKIFPWTGLVVLQSANIPILIDVWLHGLVVPLMAPIATIYGLSAYLYHSIVTKNTLYTVGNCIGLVISISILGYLLIN